MNTNTDGNLAALSAYQRAVDESDARDRAIEQIREELLRDMTLGEFFSLFQKRGVATMNLAHHLKILDDLLDRAAEDELDRRIEASQPDEPDDY
jgi:hypothetical protein